MGNKHQKQQINLSKEYLVEEVEDSKKSKKISNFILELEQQKQDSNEQQKGRKFNINQLLIYSEQFFNELRKQSKKRIKVITFLGTSGTGKSSTLNMVLNNFKDGKVKQFFEVSSQSESVTLGIDYYILEDGETINLFLDCQGFSGVNTPKIQMEKFLPFTAIEEKDINKKLKENKQKHRNQLTKLISLICGISTCVFNVTKNSRKEDCFEDLKDMIIADHQKDEEEITIDKISNFLNIKNCYFENEIYENKDFQKEFILQIFTKKKVENKDYFDIPKQYIKTIKDIQEYIKKSKYICNSQWTQSFKEEQKCESILDMLKSAFEILNKDFGDCQKNFLDIVGLQNKQKIEFEKNLTEIKKKTQENFDNVVQTINEQFSKNNLSYSVPFLTIIQDLIQQQGFNSMQNQFRQLCKYWETLLEIEINKILDKNSSQSDENKNKLLKEYSSLESIKPEKYKLQEKTMEDLKSDYSKSIFEKIAQHFYSNNVPQVFGDSSLAKIVYFPANAIAGVLAFFGSVLMNDDKQDKIKIIKNKLRDILFQYLTKLNNNFDKPAQYSFVESAVQIVCTICDDNMRKLKNQFKNSNTFFLLFFFNNLQRSISLKQKKNILDSNNQALFENGLDLYKKYQGEIKINFNNIFKIKFKNWQKDISTIYRLENNKVIVLDQEFQNSIESFGIPNNEDLIKTLIVLRNIDSFFIIEIIRQHHFQQSLIYNDDDHKDLILEESFMENFFVFTQQIMN